MLTVILILFILTSYSSTFQVPCSSVAIICPKVLAEFTCVQNVKNLQWIVPKINSNDNWNLLLISGHPTDHNSTMGIYSASIVKDDAVYVSTLTFIVPLEVNNDNMEIICNTGTGDDDDDKSCPFTVEDEPSSPVNMTVTAIDVDTVNLSWFSPLSGSSCIDHYIVSVSTIENTVQNYTTNLTSIAINGLGQGPSYSFSVITVNNIEREGTVSETVTLIMDVPGQVNSLNYSVNIVEGSYYHVNVHWDEGDNILKPPVTHYNVHHNFTSSKAFKTNGTNITFYNVLCGTLYLVQVNAENIVGEGVNKSLIIDTECEKSCCDIVVTITTNSMYLTSTLLSEEQTFVKSSSTPTSSILTEVTIQTTSKVTETQKIASTSSIVAQCSCNAEIAASTLVTAILVSLVSVLIASSLVYLLMKRTTSTNSESCQAENINKESIASKATVIYDLPNITVDDIGDKGTMQHNEAYGVL